MTLDIEAARALLEKLEKARGPDQELDALIIVAAGAASEVNPRSPTFVRMLDERSVPDDTYSRSAEVTASLDAITDLIEHVLPNCSWGVSVEPALQTEPPFDVKYHAYVGDHWPALDKSPGKWWGEASYAGGKAMALCEAFLRALVSKAESGNLVSEDR